MRIEMLENKILQKVEALEVKDIRKIFEEIGSKEILDGREVKKVSQVIDEELGLYLQCSFSSVNIARKSNIKFEQEVVEEYDISCGYLEAA